jgi:hypothetical protein
MSHAAGGLPRRHLFDRRSSFAIANRSRDQVPPSATEAALSDLERALHRDRAHVVLALSPGAEKALLLRALPERLPACVRVLHIPATAIREGDICAQVLIELGQQPGLDAEARLLGLVHDLASGGSALVLLIADAGSVPPAALRRLGRLAAAARPGLRLALVVAVEAGSQGDAVAEVVAALGVGAEKVVIETPVERFEPAAFARAPLERSGLSQDAGDRRSQGAFAAIRSPRRATSGSRAARWRPHAIVALGIAVAFLGVDRLAVPMALPQVEPGPVAELSEPIRPQAPAAIPPALPQPVAARPAGEPARDPDPKPEPVKHAAAERKVAAPAPVPSIPVSLNARPWARIEVDGRDVGVTPLADLPIAPGPHRFRAHLPDGRVVERTVHVDAYRDHISFP